VCVCQWRWRAQLFPILLCFVSLIFTMQNKQNKPIHFTKSLEIDVRTYYQQGITLSKQKLFPKFDIHL